jgi:hypothetical protein
MSTAIADSAVLSPEVSLGTPIDHSSPDTSPSNFIDSIDSFFESGALDLGDSAVPEVFREEPELGGDTLVDTNTSDANDSLAEIDQVDDFKGWTPEAARRFKELKTELKTYKAQTRELEANFKQRESRLTELEATAKDPEYAAMRERLAEFETNTLLTRLEESTAYKSLVTEPIAALVAGADEIANRHGIDPDSLLNAIAISDEAEQEERLSEVLAEVSERDKFRVYRIIEDMKPILAQRDALKENSQAALAEAQALDEERSRAKFSERAKERHSAAVQVADKLKSKLTFLSGMEGVDLSTIAADVAKINPADLDLVEGSYQAMAGKLLPKVASRILSQQREIDALTEQLAEYANAAPRAGGGFSPGPNGSRQQGPATGTSFLDAVTNAFGG